MLIEHSVNNRCVILKYMI